MRDEPDVASGVLTGAIDPKNPEVYQSELFQYRHESLAILQKYLTVSLDLGRLPSVLGGEMFRAKVTAYRVTSFEDLVIFVTDVEACLNRLSETARRFLTLNVFQDYSKEHAAAILGCDGRSARRIYCGAMDELSEILLRFHVIEPMDWIGDTVAAEGWFEGCPILRRSGGVTGNSLPPKKPCAGVKDAPVGKVLRMPMRVG